MISDPINTNKVLLSKVPHYCHAVLVFPPTGVACNAQAFIALLHQRI